MDKHRNCLLRFMEHPELVEKDLNYLEEEKMSIIEKAKI